MGKWGCIIKMKYFRYYSNSLFFISFCVCKICKIVYFDSIVVWTALRSINDKFFNIFLFYHRNLVLLKLVILNDCYKQSRILHLTLLAENWHCYDLFWSALSYCISHLPATFQNCPYLWGENFLPDLFYAHCCWI